MDKIIIAIIFFIFGQIFEYYRYKRLEISNLKILTNNFFQKDLPDKKTYGGDRKIFYESIKKHFSDYEDQINIFGYSVFLSAESIIKLSSITKNIDIKYNDGHGEKANQIREYCRGQLIELQKQLKINMNIPLYKIIWRIIKDKFRKILFNWNYNERN